MVTVKEFSCHCCVEIYSLTLRIFVSVIDICNSAYRLDEVSSHMKKPMWQRNTVASRSCMWLLGSQLTSANSQEKAGPLSYTITRKCILATTWMSMEVDSSPVKSPVEKAAWPIQWVTLCETLKHKIHSSHAENPGP